MSEQRWTIRVCTECGADDRYRKLGSQRHWSRGERCLGVPVDVVVVPASVLDEARSRVRELEDALRLIAETDWVDAVLDPDRALRVARAVLASSSAPTDTTCPDCGGCGYLPGPFLPHTCPRCSGSGRVTKEHR